MKKLFILMLGFIFYFPANSQLLTDLEQVSPFHEELASIKKDGQWAFINVKGEIVIGFRDDLVNTTSDKQSQLSEGIVKSYPKFVNGRCLIEKTKEGIPFFGYIDEQGNVVIEADFINATNFKEGYAIVIQYSKKVVGQNKLLDKDVVVYQKEEFIIDRSGKIITSLFNARNYNPDNLKSGHPPEVTSIFLGNRLVAVKTENQNWQIYNF